MDTTVLRCFLLLLLVLGFGVMHYFAPLQAGSVVFDLGLIALAVGLMSLIHPLQILAITTRKAAFFVVIAGVLTCAVALIWPASSIRSAGNASLLDRWMPRYYISEFHSERVHASPERVYQAVRETTFSDVKGLALLMSLRRAAAGRLREVRAPAKPFLEALSQRGSGFILLDEAAGHEIVMGTAGRFWSTGAARDVVTREDFTAYAEPGAAKSVFNIVVEDAGDGWSRVTTETRVFANDEAALRKMTAYWRVIYPGSATIRRMWLRAIKQRAERPH